jgi:hypothetical protein
VSGLPHFGMSQLFTAEVALLLQRGAENGETQLESIASPFRRGAGAGRNRNSRSNHQHLQLGIARTRGACAGRCVFPGMSGRRPRHLHHAWCPAGAAAGGAGQEPEARLPMHGNAAVAEVDLRTAINGAPSDRGPATRAVASRALRRGW